jgi:hypothetical protein
MAEHQVRQMTERVVAGVVLVLSALVPHQGALMVVLVLVHLLLARL